MVNNARWWNSTLSQKAENRVNAEKKISTKPKTPIEYAALHPKKTRGKTTAEVIEMMKNKT